MRNDMTSLRNDLHNFSAQSLWVKELVLGVDLALSYWNGRPFLVL